MDDPRNISAVKIEHGRTWLFIQWAWNLPDEKNENPTTYRHILFVHDGFKVFFIFPLVHLISLSIFMTTKGLGKRYMFFFSPAILISIWYISSRPSHRDDWIQFAPWSHAVNAVVALTDVERVSAIGPCLRKLNITKSFKVSAGFRDSYAEKLAGAIWYNDGSTEKVGTSNKRSGVLPSIIEILKGARVSYSIIRHVIGWAGYRTARFLGNTAVCVEISVEPQSKQR